MQTSFYRKVIHGMKDLSKKEYVEELFDRLYPMCRSILGQGYRESLEILKEYIPFQEDVYLSGSKVLNWVVPQEWVIREAWIKDSEGNTVIDFKNNNLHVLNYSDNIDGIFSLEELKKHIYTHNLDEDAIPYTFSYYKKRWGFCMSQKQLNQLADGQYHAYIDSEFVEGRLVVGEAILEGKEEKQILLTSYLCHPSMANNELSGPLVLAMLYQRIAAWKNRRYTYRFVINPETIGSISYLSRHGDEVKEKLYTGLVLTCLGGTEKLRYKTSRSEDAPMDKLITKMNEESAGKFRVEIFDPTSGSDERQYCSPGFDLPMGQMARKAYADYKEYHTSLDTKELMGIENIMESCDEIEKLLLKLEQEEEIDGGSNDINVHERGIGSIYYKNLYPYGEVKLGDYDLYPTINTGGTRKIETQDLRNEPWFIRSVMMILSYSDGRTSLEYCAKRLELPIEKVQKVAETLVEKVLLEKKNI